MLLLLVSVMPSALDDDQGGVKDCADVEMHLVSTLSGNDLVGEMSLDRAAHADSDLFLALG